MLESLGFAGSAPLSAFDGFAENELREVFEYAGGEPPMSVVERFKLAKEIVRARQVDDE